MRTLILSLAVLSASACGDDGMAPPADAAVDSRVPEVIALAPVIPWLAAGAPASVMRPCPMTWRAADNDGAPTCEPFPTAEPEACLAGESHLPGESACAAVGDPCPAGSFADGLPADAVHVDPSAAAGGDGSRAAPYTTLSEVPWRSLGAGSTVALARGSYEGPLSIRPGVTVTGACAAETQLTGSTAPIVAVIRVDGTGPVATVKNLSVVRPPQSGVALGAGQALSLEGIVIDGAVDIGIDVEGRGAILSLHEAVVRQTRSGVRGWGWGARVRGESTVTATRTVFEENEFVGVLVRDPGTVFELRDSVVRDTRSRSSDGDFGRGADIDDGARFVAERSVFFRNRNTGVFAATVGTEVSLTDVVVRQNQPRTLDGLRGRGLAVQIGARLGGERVSLDGNHEYGLFASDPGTEVSLTDSVIHGTVPTEGSFGRGIESSDGARVTVERSLLTRNQSSQLWAGGGTIVARDVVVRDSTPPPTEVSEGFALRVGGAGLLEAERVLVERAADVAIVSLSTGSLATLRDVIVRDTQPEARLGVRGYGLIAEEGGEIGGERIRIERSLAVGALALSGGRIDVSDLAVAGVLTNDVSTYSFGYGVAAVGGALRFEGFEIGDASICGIFLADLVDSPEPVSVSVSQGVVMGSTIGACVQSLGFDISTLSSDVDYVDNGVNLDTTELPVPSAPQHLQGGGS